MNTMHTGLADPTATEPKSGYRRHPGPLNDFRALDREWCEHSVPERFGVQVARNPNRTAIKTKNGELTYAALEEIANRIGNAILQRIGVREEAACLLFEHDAAVPAAILGILKAGKFFVSLDAEYPRERNEFLLADSKASVIVTNTANQPLADSLAEGRIGGRIEVVNIDVLGAATDDRPPYVQSGPDSVIYLTYTSGSTGKPKGVVHTHRSLLHKTLRYTNGGHFNADDRIALFFKYTFGAAMSDLFVALLNGAVLCPIDVKQESPTKILEWLARETITFFHTVPTFFRHLTAVMSAGAAFPDLRLIRLAGETIYGRDVELFQQYFGGKCLLQVGMGSTETGTILASYYDEHSECSSGVVPPGYPTEDIEIDLIDEQGRAVPTGVTGEFAVRSRYLFSGYWQRPDLTAQVLPPDSNGSAERTYLMRDLGCRLADGRIAHVGRKDAQVKIRGHRVEIGEVELALLAVPGIKEAAVTVKDAGDGEKRLIGHVVRQPNAQLPVSSLRGLLREKLPVYMTPAAFVELDALPLTVSGKIDRVSLAANPLPPMERDFVGPRDHLETHLVGIWQEILKTEGIGVRDDFFDLGGDSLRAVQMVARIDELLEREINLGNFSSGVTIEKLADALEAEEHENLQQPILQIQAGRDRPPIFFCHGDYISGGVFCRNLARHLGPDQPFYAIPPHGLDGRPLPSSLAAMATDRIDALLEVQPNGPFVLGGFCWGGLLALEMACQMQARGLEIDNLLVIDADPKHVGLRPVRKVIRAAARVIGADDEAEIRWYRNVRWFVTVLAQAKGASAKLRFVAGKIARLLSRGARVQEERDRQHSASQDSPVSALDRHERWSTYHRINQDHVAGRYAGRVVLFRSSRLQERYPGDPRAGWRRIAPSIETHDIAGDHWTCITTHVADVASKMSRCLRV